MSNNYFRFKQFTVQQENCAMKVCTDACLFGALLADDIKVKSAAQVLDIGTGTGLLSLMLAQRIPSCIDAVEIDTPAYAQAKANFDQSPWHQRLHIFNTDIQHFQTQKKYDCIISNPPFFENDLHSTNARKNNAKHDTSLTLEMLLRLSVTLLNNSGILAVLLPAHRVAYFIQQAQQAGLFAYRQILIQQSTLHDPFRGIIFLSSSNNAPVYQHIISIKNEQNQYTPEFSYLLKDYYLYL